MLVHGRKVPDPPRWRKTVVVQRLPTGSVASTGRALAMVLAIFLGGRASVYAVRYWLVEGFSLPSAGMAPTLLTGDHVMVRKRVGEIRRGDIVVFRYPPDPSLTYLKRVIALGGDTVEVRGNAVFVNGVRLSQTNDSKECEGLAGDQADTSCVRMTERLDGRNYEIMVVGNYASDMPKQVVPPGTFFVMGDNRNNSKDSRYWGTVPAGNMVGTPTLIYLSKGSEGIDWRRAGSAIQ